MDSEQPDEDETAEEGLDPASIDRKDEFTPFDELTRKLVRVPKKEIDEKRRKA